MILDDRMVDAVLAVSSCHLRVIKKSWFKAGCISYYVKHIISDLHVHNTQILRKGIHTVSLYYNQLEFQ